MPGSYVPAYSVGPLIGLTVNGVLCLLCLAILFTYSHYRPLKSLLFFYLSLSVYFLGFVIYGYQQSEQSIILGYRLMLVALCFAPVTWIWFALALQNVRAGAWAWAALIFATMLACTLILVEHPAVLGPPLKYQEVAKVWHPNAYVFRPVIYTFDLVVVLLTMFFFWFRWWPAPGKPAYVRAVVAGLALWFLGGLHDAAYALQWPTPFHQPIMWLGSVWLSLCLALALAFHVRGLEDALRASEAKFSKAFAANPDGLTIATLEDGRFLEVNEAFLVFAGYKRGEVLGKTSQDLGLWGEPDTREGLLARLVRKGEVRDWEVVLRNSSGQGRDVLLSAELIPFGANNAVLCVIRDVTDRKRVEDELARHRLHLEDLVDERTRELVTANAELSREIAERRRTEEALRQSRANLQTMFDSLYDFLFVFDEDGRIMLINPQVIDRLGYAEFELLGQEAIMLHPADRREEAVRLMSDIAAGLMDRNHLPLMAKDGAVIPVETRITRGLWGDRPALFGISRDISERVRSQEVLRQLAAGVAHNFNNLLAAILGNAQAAEGLLKRTPPELDRLGRLLDNVVYSALSGRGVVKRLAAFVGGQRPGEDIQGACEVEEVVAAALEIAQTAFLRATSENILFETDLASGLHARVPRDELMEICLNLIRNAMEAMPQGGVLSVRSGFEQDQAFVSFTDSGSGMDQQTLDHIFEPFFTTKGVKGQGLGLASSRGMIRSYGGEIEAASQPGQGSCFTVRLGVGGEAPALEGIPPDQDRPPAGTTVLLVEDEYLVAMGARSLLEEAGLVVALASRVSEAVETLETFTPQVVLCDLGLPDGSGWDVARLLALRCQTQNIAQPPLIILTGWTSDPLPFEHPQDVPSAWGVLHKPVEKDTLLKTLAQAVRALP